MSKTSYKELYEFLSRIDNPKDMQGLFDDLCTYKEIEQFSQRLKAARLLMEGKTYEQVIKETDISSATLSRVSRCVKYGKGYSRLIGIKKDNQ